MTNAKDDDLAETLQWVGTNRYAEYIASYREECVAAERALIRADVDALAAAWVRGDSVEVSRLLVKLRGES